MDLELDVNFQSQTLSGHVVLSVERVNPNAKVLVSWIFRTWLETFVIVSCFRFLIQET